VRGIDVRCGYEKRFHTAWVKRRDTRREQMFPALLPKDMLGLPREVRFVHNRKSRSTSLIEVGLSK
jgi:hypothetical protein